ncbi:MAG: S28 family serine protease [Odoribacter sp.]
MKKLLSLLLFVVCCSVVAFATDEMMDKLQKIPQISDIKKMEVKSFNGYYQFYFEQPIDHTDRSKGVFKQRVYLGHKGLNAPVIVELEGYSIGSAESGELADLLKGNQLTIEHRFFDESVPEGGIPWDYLTIKQAAADQHEIIEAIKKSMYPTSKWVSTGISKGGQTAIYHRYFYPADVNVTVPYVAPLNLEYVDARLEKFLDKLGTPKGSLETVFGGGGSEQNCHWSIRDFQTLCFENKEQLLPRLEKLAAEKGYTYQVVGGEKRALELMILEYPFSFWQWGNSCEEIPHSEDNSWDEIFDYLVKVSTPDFFEDKFIVRMQPFFYAALTETGMYDYKIKPFKKFLPDEKDIDFSFALPRGVEKKMFDGEQMKAIYKWLQTDAEKILFVYGGSDPWYATGVDLKKNWKCRKYVRGDMGHSCRIKDFDPVSREDLIDTLKEWLE